jgi:hypothetical protein
MANETIGDYQRSSQAGMQTAGFLFGCMLIISILFGLYIYKSCEPEVSSISQTQDGENNHQRLTNG